MNIHNNSTQANVKNFVGLTVRGFCIGVADIIPGVSGGTMAFILGIYTRFIVAIKSFDTIWLIAFLKLDRKTILSRPDFGFLVPIGLGLLSALVFFTHVVSLPKLLVSHRNYLYGLFFGLIVGSIIIFISRLGGIRANDLVKISAGLLVGFIVIYSSPEKTPDTWWFVMLCGTLAICAMILPGISGAFVLLILGKYAYILDAFGHFEWQTIAAFGIGAGIGLVLFSRIIFFALDRFNRETLCTLCGMLMASLWSLWPFQQHDFLQFDGTSHLMTSSPLWPTFDAQTVFVLGFVCMGLGISLVLRVIGEKAGYSDLVIQQRVLSGTRAMDKKKKQ